MIEEMIDVLDSDGNSTGKTISKNEAHHQGA